MGNLACERQWLQLLLPGGMEQGIGRGGGETKPMIRPHPVLIDDDLVEALCAG